ncbi:TPA: hypothetical protein QCZ04_002734 [Bacillus cereus]|uniref:RNA-directed DNA polymerase n=1 Tax=Bacillus cereus group sp. FL70 TaxID=3040254 RepID=UPI00330490FF|nr:hypothetical protein [Bacillus cereus]
MRENLFLRTDVLPEELPILFTNRNVYLNFSKLKTKEMLELERDLKRKNEGLRAYITVPYNFYIPKNDRSSRKMALLHPIAQLQAFAYILRYDQLISLFCKQSEYSVRSPIIRNHPVYDYSKGIQSSWKRMDEEFSFSRDTTVTTDEDEKYFYSYFSYKQYKKIQDLYDSNKFNRDKYKYQYFMKFDVQNFFPSLYTHALSWAIFGDKPLAKKLRGVDEAFGNATDQICRNINFGETNGIVVGPEFSRVMAELLMTRVDMKIQEELDKKNIILKRDYMLYRYVDDFFLFAHNKESAHLIESVIETELDNFNLKMNSAKTQLQEKPFEMVDRSIVELKNAISLFQFNYSRYKNSNISFRKYSSWLNVIWKDLFSNIELIVCNYPQSKNRIINYFLKRVRTLIPRPTEVNKYNLSYILEVVSNIFTLAINTKSTNSLIAVYLKVVQEYKKILAGESVSEDIHSEIEFINERIFQHLYMNLRNNYKQIEQMFDLFIFIKTLDKKLSSSFLCKVIEEYKDSYFVLCSVGYYILNEKKSHVLDCYKTVYKKLRDAIFNKITDYKTKGSDNLLLEAEYFYFINDFSYYPGFSERERKKLKNIIESNIKRFSFYSSNPGSKESLIKIKDLQKEMFGKIMSDSYYDWKQTTDNFLREVAKKSINLPRRNLWSDY